MLVGLPPINFTKNVSAFIKLFRNEMFIVVLGYIFIELHQSVIISGKIKPVTIVTVFFCKFSLICSQLKKENYGMDF
jgi:hypothetical protein